MQRRYRREDPAVGDHVGHVAHEEGEQQGADMGAVDIGVGHDDDLAVASLLDVEAAPRAGTDDLDDGCALGV